MWVSSCDCGGSPVLMLLWLVEVTGIVLRAGETGVSNVDAFGGE